MLGRAVSPRLLGTSPALRAKELAEAVARKVQSRSCVDVCPAHPEVATTLVLFAVLAGLVALWSLSGLGRRSPAHEPLRVAR